MNLIMIPRTEDELLKRAQRLTGRSLGELAMQSGQHIPTTLHYHKGWVGQLLEVHLGANSNNLPLPDFWHLNIELKTIPLNAKGRAQESTYICTAAHTHGITWETSVLKSKLARILWIPIEADKAIPIAQRKIASPILWSPNPETMRILQNDFETLLDALYLGTFDKISAKLGEFLQLRPKAANASTLIELYDEELHLTKIIPKGFYLRQKLTNKIINKEL